ncbi:MAG: hypothetical protein HRF49_10965 [bacterium]|jgi:hypothetical protein
MGKLIGYMDGTSPEWLTTLQALGCDTMPLSNGYDGHGLNIQMLTASNKPDIIICWLHKLVSHRRDELTVKDMLHATTQFGIKVLVACPEQYHGVAEKLLEGKPENVTLVPPENMLRVAEELIG